MELKQRITEMSSSSSSSSTVCSMKANISSMKANIRHLDHSHLFSSYTMRNDRQGGGVL